MWDNFPNEDKSFIFIYNKWGEKKTNVLTLVPLSLRTDHNTRRNVAPSGVWKAPLHAHTGVISSGWEL